MNAEQALVTVVVSAIKEAYEAAAGDFDFVVWNLERSGGPYLRDRLKDAGFELRALNEKENG